MKSNWLLSLFGVLLVIEDGLVSANEAQAADLTKEAGERLSRFRQHATKE